MMTRGVCSILVWCLAGTACAADLQADLKGRWKLAGDCQDSSGQGNHGTARSVVYGEGPHGAANGAAVFNGRDSMMQVPDAPSLRLGSGDFTICLWARPETPMRGVFGDLVGKFDAKRRCGVNFHLAGSSPGYNAMSDTRHVHFGIDDGYLGTWEDCGKPRASNALVTCLIVFEDQLYCGIADAAEPSQAARVFRWTGGRQWVDCGRLGSDPNHLSVQAMIVHRGKLYAGTGIYDWVRARGQIQGTPPAAKTRVFVYQGGTQWQDLGQVGEGSRVLTMASFNGELYVGLDANPGGGKCFKHNGTAWIDCGAPDGVNLQNLLPLGGVLYAATHGRVHRYEGGQRWSCIGDHPFEITQTHCLDVAGGKLHAGTWPQGYVLRHEGDQKWSNAGRLGLVPGQPECNEVNDLIVHNGKLYAGVIPKAEVYRYESDDQWTLVGSLVHRPDWARNRLDTWCRLTAFASFQGKALRLHRLVPGAHRGCCCARIAGPGLCDPGRAARQPPPRHRRRVEPSGGRAPRPRPAFVRQRPAGCAHRGPRRPLVRREQHAAVDHRLWRTGPFCRLAGRRARVCPGSQRPRSRPSPRHPTARAADSWFLRHAKPVRWHALSVSEGRGLPRTPLPTPIVLLWACHAVRATRPARST